MTSSAPPGLARFNAAADRDAAGLLHEVCASRSWGAAVARGRPYATVGELLEAADAAMAGLTAADLAEAMAAHPPIGRPTPGDAASAREQSGVRDAERAELLELNLAYQERHGQVFLICATAAPARRCWRRCASGSTMTPTPSARSSAPNWERSTASG